MRSKTALAIALCGSVFACSSSDVPHRRADPAGETGGGSAGGTPITGGGSAGDTTGTGGDGGGGPIGSGDSGVITGGQGGFDTCASDKKTAQPTQVDVYVMLDKSGSMTLEGNRWGPVSSALKAFIADPNSAGLGVGVQYFPLADGSATKCDTPSYATPDVPIGILPDQAPPLTKSIDAHFFTTAEARNPDHYGTPTRPALEGAVNYVKDWIAAHPTHIGVVLLATDGQPMTSLCQPNSIKDSVALAQAASSWTPPVHTYVIGVGDVGNLNDLATAGGSGSPAFIVDGTGQNTQQQFAQALDKIRTSLIPCDYPIPATGNGGAVDPGKVNVEYGSGGGTPKVIPKAPDQAGCAAADGWYYDNETAPTKVMMCPATCTAIQGDRKAEINVLFGCPSVTVN